MAIKIPYWVHEPFFTSCNYPKCKLKKLFDAKFWLEKAIKMYNIIDLDRRFEFRRIRDIRVRDSESRLYMNLKEDHLRNIYVKFGRN